MTIRNRDLAITRIVLVLFTFTVLFGCVHKENQFDIKKQEFADLRAHIESGDVDWVNSSAERIFTLDPEGKYSGGDVVETYRRQARDWGKGERGVLGGDGWLEIHEDKKHFLADLAVLWFTSPDKKVKESVLVALKKWEVMYEKQDDNSILISSGTAISTWERLDVVRAAVLLTEIAKTSDSVKYDLSDRRFVKDELCRAVGSGDIAYTAFLIGNADFDVGMLRCYDTDNLGWGQYAAYTGKSSCPLSLRRVSGINAARAISARNSAWLSNVNATDFSKLKDSKEIQSALGGTFRGLPSLQGVNSMNQLIDKYNKWSFGGDCTEDRLYKNGRARVPAGW